MPVLTVSEISSPQVGFSRNWVIQPSSSVTITPYSSGSSTRVSVMVAVAFLAWCEAMTALRSKSVSASPLMTRKGSSPKNSAAFLTLPAVPSGTSSTA